MGEIRNVGPGQKHADILIRYARNQFTFNYHTYSHIDYLDRCVIFFLVSVN